MALGLANPAAADDGLLKLHEARKPGAIEVSGENRDPDAPHWVWVSFSAQQNAAAQPALPAGFVLQPLEQRLLFTVSPQFPEQGWSYGLSELSGVGDPEREPDKDAVYLLPWDHGTKHTVTQGYYGRVTHQNQCALDFDMPDGTGVDAARAGTVIDVKDDSDEGGMQAWFSGRDNFVRVLHADSTWAVYAHLMKGGALVQKGQGVQAGERIGLSGHTGLASGPHLHFAVYRAGWQGPLTIPTVFKTGLSSTASIEEGRTYYSWHPGGPAFTPVLAADLREQDLRGLTRTARGQGVSLRQQTIDRRTLVWADNAGAVDVDMAVDFAQASGVRSSVELPWRGRVPAGLEVYCFWIDYVGDGASAFQLKTSWTERPASPAAAPGRAGAGN